MGNLALTISVLAILVVLALVGFLGKLLWKFGQHLKVKSPIFWYIYNIFWILVLIGVLLIVAAVTFNFYEYSDYYLNK